MEMFRQQLPRIYELRDLIKDPALPGAYFQNLESNLQTSPSAMRAFTAREKEFQGLDAEAWTFLKTEASPYLTRKDPNGRGWQQLFDILNQGRAYNHLKSIGCSNIRFVPRSSIETPDLEGLLGGVTVLCEVKTINISAEEVRARRNFTGRTIKNYLDEGFFRKLQADIEKARAQMQAYDSTGHARYFVYINPCFDDFLGEYKDEYFQQIGHSLPTPLYKLPLLHERKHLRYALQFSQ